MSDAQLKRKSKKYKKFRSAVDALEAIDAAEPHMCTRSIFWEFLLYLFKLLYSGYQHEINY